MPKEVLECLKYFQHITLTDVPESVTANRHGVLSFFRQATRTPPNKYISEPSRLLLNAYESRRFTWEQLAVLLKAKVQYLTFYWKRVHGGTSFIVARPDQEAFSVPSAVRARQRAYVEVMNEVSAALLKRASNSVPKNAPLAEGKTEEYWTSEDPYFGNVGPVRSIVARSYEMGLLKDREFLDEADRLRRGIAQTHWCYTYPNDLFSTGTYPFPRVKGKVQKLLNAFCQKWCLESIESGRSAEANWNITAMHVRSKNTADGTGIKVFIPRYYAFTHINRHRDDDFAGLKYHLDTMFASPRNRSDVESRDVRKARAKAYREKYLAAGLPKSLAWEMTAYQMRDVWRTYDTIRTKLGRQPRHVLGRADEAKTLMMYLVKAEMMSIPNAWETALKIMSLTEENMASYVGWKPGDGSSEPYFFSLEPRMGALPRDRLVHSHRRVKTDSSSST